MENNKFDKNRIENYDIWMSIILKIMNYGPMHYLMLLRS